ncbi:MAG: cytochrome b N-terminal domain-containing protein [Planctomycetes bacterium]|nr:cytochrome b N-terminal domain-containing protein [Planctomycetota bacterium]
MSFPESFVARELDPADKEPMAASSPLTDARRALQAFLDEPLPARTGWPHALDSVCLALLLLQFATGIVLSLYYTPSPASAWESVRYVDSQVVLGRWLRALHHGSVSGLVVAVALHLTQVFLWAGFKGPRRFTWWIGATLLLVVLGFGFTGYLLPWDLRAYFGTNVGLHIAADAPLVGPLLARLMQGGESIGKLTLPRFYAVHVVLLPLAAAALITLHLALVRRYGVSPPGVAEGDPIRPGEPFYPRQAVRDAVAVLAAVSIVSLLAWLPGAPLEMRADPANTEYVPHPDWYFLGLQHLLRLFSGRRQVLATVVLPGLAVGLLYLVPVLERSPERRPSRRKFAIASGLAFLLLALGLTLAGWRALERERAARAAIAPSPGRATPEPEPPAVAGAHAARGKELYEALRCALCHEAPEAGTGVNLPPALRFAGSKFRREWLVDYLRAPSAIRWYREGVRPVQRMPDFHLSAEEAGALADHLGTLTDDKLLRPTAVRWSEPPPGAEEHGRQLYQQYACYGCHAVGADGKQIGPDLTRVGGKLQEDFMLHFVRHPQRIVPDTPMKDNDLWDEEAEAIVRHLRVLR